MNFFTESFSCYHYSENHSADQYLSFLLHDAFQVDLWAQEILTQIQIVEKAVSILPPRWQQQKVW